MSTKLSLWDLYQRQNVLDQTLSSHTHNYSQLTGFHSCAHNGRADYATEAGNASKVTNSIVLKNANGTNVYYNGSAYIDLSGGVYYAKTASSASSATNADTVDNLHAYQMATLSESGTTHGTDHVLTCRYNVDKDGRFKFVASQGHQIRCDYATNAANATNATNAGYAGTAGLAYNLNCSNYGVPIEIGQYIDFHQAGTNTDYSVRLTGTANTLSCSGTFSATKVYNAVWNDYAEWFERDNKNEQLEAGDILAWGNNGVVKATNIQKNVVGVFSDPYGHIVGGKELENMEDNIKNFVPIGLMGRVNVKVKGKVNKGDFIILSSDTPGVGVAGNFIPGIVVGKALENHDSDSIDRISILITTI